MSITEQFFSNIDWLATIKDFVIILLSIIALFSTYIQNRKAKRNAWITDFRRNIAKMISLISQDIDKSNKSNIHETFECMTMINLYIDHNDKLHSSLILEINKLKGLFREFSDEKSNSTDVGNKIVDIIKIAKKIIDIEESKFF